MDNDSLGGFVIPARHEARGLSLLCPSEPHSVYGELGEHSL
jgi:hypothetical protein